MIPTWQSPADQSGPHEALVQAVPAGARRILEVGCGAGLTGARLKALDPHRQVFGVEADPVLAAQAAKRLDRVFVLDVARADVPLPPGQVDCLLYPDTLGRLADPEAVLTRHRPLLAPGGVVLAAVGNVQHFSVLARLLRGDFQYQPAGLLAAANLRFFTYATVLKLLLDTGYAPTIRQTIPLPVPAELLEAAAPLLQALGLHAGRTRDYLTAGQYLVQGTPVPYLGPQAAPAPDVPLTFVACVADEATLQANLLASPCLAPGTPHEVILLRGCRSAAEGLNAGLTRARHALVVCLHQDVYLPHGWPARCWQQYQLAQQNLGPVGVLGVYGLRGPDPATGGVGQVVDRHRLLAGTIPLPAVVDTLDECLLALPRGTPCRFDPTLGFHFYGADLCLTARQQGLTAVAVEALAFHNSAGYTFPPAFYASGQVFARKWAAALPVATTCTRVDSRWLHAPPEQVATAAR